jgi:hypothetical protein
VRAGFATLQRIPHAHYLRAGNNSYLEGSAA